MIDFDVETTGLQWYWHEPFLAQFLGDASGEPALRPHPADGRLIQQWLGFDDGYEAWNSKFDLHMLRAAGYELPPESQWHDGMVRAHVCDERPNNGLALRHEKLFGGDARADERAVKSALAAERKARRKASKDDGTEYVEPNYSDVPREIMDPYAAGDVLQQRAIRPVYEAMLDRTPELREVYERERKVLPALFWAEERGVPIEREHAVLYEAQLTEELDRLHGEAVGLAGIPHFNPGSTAQLAEALERRGADLSFVSKTPTGRLSMDEENLAAVDDPLALKVRELRGVSKLYGTYVKTMLHPHTRDGIPFEPLLDSNDLLHPNFNQVGARTARMSSSDPNIQNWHRTNLNLRYLVRARPGKVLVVSDLDAIEARVLAAFAPGVLKELLLSGASLHAHTARGVGIRDRRRSDGSIETAYDRAKVFFYAVMYGAGVQAIRKQFGCSQAEAKEMIQRLHATYPEIGELQNRIEFALVDEGYIKTPWGRRQRPEGTKSWQIEKEAYKFLNYLIQGTAAEILKDAAIRCHEQGVPVIIYAHDEIVAEVDEADAAEAEHVIVEALTDHPRITERMPLEADAKVVKHWSQAKDETFQPAYLR